MRTEPMTQKAFDKLSSELSDLKNNQRGAIAQEIQSARELGDLKENAEYHAAKEKQAHMETKIAKLEDIKGRAQVIDPSTLPHLKVSFGSTVRVLDLENDKELQYTIVGEVETQVEKGLISFHSPLAKNLLGKAEGEEITAQLPNGSKDFEILEVGYKSFG